MSTTKRVIKNTGFLYIRMGITVLISLYTTRLILSSLGASDFGIFNIIGGAIAMLGFLNSTMANATQRFMSYAEGEGIEENKRQVFNTSILLHLCIGIITVVILLAIMPLLFDQILNIDSHRIYAAKIVYLCLIGSTFLTIINVPYDALMNAHENMLYYAIIGIFESLLRLGIAFICVYSSYDKLIIYAILMASIPLVTLSIMKIYCHHAYGECVIAPKTYFNKVLIKRIATFSLWNFLTAISSLFTAQGNGLVLNHFFGTRLNAAQGVATQINGQLSAFASNMMKALNPVIVKNAGAGNVDAMNKAVIAGCKFTTLLTMFFAIPIIIEMPFVMSIWLKEVPKWAVEFCSLQLIVTMICQSANSASTAVYASGKIKYYAIYKSLMNIMPLFATYIGYRLGLGPWWLYIPMIAIWAIGGNMVIIYYAKKLCSMDITNYLRHVLIPLIIVATLMTLGGLAIKLEMECGWIRLFTTAIVTTIIMIMVVWTLFINENEKSQIMEIIHSRRINNKKN